MSFRKSRRERKPNNKVQKSVTLYRDQKEWLEAQVKQRKYQNVSHAVREAVMLLKKKVDEEVNQ